jgi:O-antigen/teichoic acid export membrane protein
MHKIWEYSTVVFLVQLVIGAPAFEFTGDARALIITAGVAIAVMLTYPLFIFAVDLETDHDFVALIAVAFGAASATLGAFFINTASTTNTNLALLITGCVVLLVTFFAVNAAREVNGDSPLWQRFLCALPLGIGTVFGGLLIVLRQHKKT